MVVQPVEDCVELAAVRRSATRLTQESQGLDPDRLRHLIQQPAQGTKGPSPPRVSLLALLRTLRDISTVSPFVFSPLISPGFPSRVWKVKMALAPYLLGMQGYATVVHWYVHDHNMVKHGFTGPKYHCFPPNL